MKMNPHRRFLVLAAFVGLGLSACNISPASRANLTDEAQASLEDLYRRAPAARALSDKAAAILVFPSVTQAGLIVGAQYGRGVMYVRGRPEGFYNITGGSFGLQAGAQNFSQAYFFTTIDALNTFRKSEGFEVGVGLDVAVASVGVSEEISTATLQKPLVVFVWGQQGLMAGVKVEGQKITKLDTPPPSS